MVEWIQFALSFRGSLLARFVCVDGDSRQVFMPVIAGLG